RRHSSFVPAQVKRQKGDQMSESMRWTRRNAIGAALAAAAAAVLPRTARAATTLRWASVLPANHPAAVMMERVAKQVRDETGGSVDIQTFPAGQLRSSRDLIEAT